MLERRFAPLAGLCLGLVALAVSMCIGWRLSTTLTDETKPSSQTATIGAAEYTRSAIEAAQDGVRSDKGSSTALRRTKPQPADTGPTIASHPLMAEEQARLIEALSRRVALLEKTIRRQARVLRDLQASALPIDLFDLDEASIAAIEDEERRLAEDASLQAQDRLWANERQFELEDVDPHWSANAVIEVSEAIAGAAIDGVHVVGLECRSSICRVELNYTEPHAQAQVELAFGRLSLEMAGGMPVKDESGPDTTIRTYYMTQPGGSTF